MQDEHFRIYSDPECVKDFIENNYGGSTREALFALVRKNPEWGRQSGETKSGYYKRMRELQAPLLGSVKRLETPVADG